MEVSANVGRPRRAFTLVELLTVIVIIGVLAGLITVAVQRARVKAVEARALLEINLMDAALQQFKTTYGQYPPDNLTNANSAAVEAFLRTAFPRYTKGSYGSLYARFSADVQSSCSITPGGMDSASAMVFWLGGVRDPSKSGWVPDGFCKDPQNPFVNRSGGGTATQRTDPLFNFDPERINLVNTYVHYYPDFSGAYANDCPYIYFLARNKSYSTANAQPPDGILPYRRTTTDYYNPDKFQIISAGLDNKFGSGSQVIGSGALPAVHYDNLTNFAEGRLEDLF